MASNTNEFIENKLQECLTSIYDSSRIATEINGLESKVDSLNSIRQTLISSENISPTNLDQMNKTIDGLQTDINSKREIMSTSEKQVVKGFSDVITHISSASSKKAVETTTKWTEMLSMFEKSLSATDESIKDLRANKMDATEKDELKSQIETFKDNIIKTFKANIANLTETNRSALAFVSNKLETMLKENDPTKVAQEVEASLDGRIKAQLQTIQQENQKALDTTGEKFEGLSQEVVKKVSDLIHQTLSPGNIQNLITTTPEYDILRKGAENMVRLSDQQAGLSATSIDAIKQSIAHLTNELVELKQSSQQTKAVVDGMRSQALPTVANTSEINHQAAVKRMEEMERNVSVIHNHIKMIETVVKIKAAEVDDVSNGSNKRARIDLEGNSVNHDQYMSAIADMETRHQRLLDFIVQCKDTVLDEEFHNRLEVVIAKIEQVLLNHERFIHFLVDPFAASRNEKVSISTAAVPEGTLSPAMIDAISKLVKKTAEEVALPLEQKIKLLEEKLQARSS